MYLLYAMPWFVIAMPLQADSDALFINTGLQQLILLHYFVDAHACFVVAIADFVDDVLRQPGDGLRWRGKHDVFTNYGHRF